MSDGPYKSLSMRRAWKKVAKSLENENFDVQQVASYIDQAVLKDFRRDVPSKVVNLIKSAFEGQLFPDQHLLDLSNARRLLDGSALGALLLDCVSQVLAEGKTGLDGLTDALSVTVEDWNQREARQIEEHYWRHKDSPEKLTIAVRDRLQMAMGNVSAEGIALVILGIESNSASEPVRYKGLDDGVPLP